MPIISVVKKFTYFVEGSIQLPEWYDPTIHKYHYCDCCSEIKVFKKEHNPVEDDHIWKGVIEFDDANDVDHDFVDDRVFELKPKK